MAGLDLRGCVGFSLFVTSRAYFLVMVRGLLAAGVLLVEQRLWGMQASVAQEVCFPGFRAQAQ